MENDSKPRMYSPVGEKFVSEMSVDSNCEKKAKAASGYQTKIFTVSQSQDSRKRKNSESSGDPGKLLHDLFSLLLRTSTSIKGITQRCLFFTELVLVTL